VVWKVQLGGGGGRVFVLKGEGDLEGQQLEENKCKEPSGALCCRVCRKSTKKRSLSNVEVEGFTMELGPFPVRKKSGWGGGSVRSLQQR